MTAIGSVDSSISDGGSIPITTSQKTPECDPAWNPEIAPPALQRGSTVLVTGATGFIGGRLVEQLVQQPDVHVRCIIRNVRRATRVGRLPVELLHVDLCNADEVNRAIKGVDYVFHCAYDWQSRRQNIDGLRNLVEACTVHSVKRLVHVSTFAVYEPFQDGPLTEESPDGDRSNVYVDTKLALEEVIFAAARNRRVAATIVQPSIVYGPFCVPWTINPAEKLIFGDVILPEGEEGVCNAVYIDDLVDGLILAAVSSGAVGERFVMSGPTPVTWATFFAEFARALGTKPPLFWPRERIEKQKAQVQNSTQKRFPSHPHEVAAIPKRVLKMIAGWNLARKVLVGTYDAMPIALRKLLPSNHHYSSGLSRTRGATYLPDPIYSSKATLDSKKARLKLGYRPRFDFQRGMELTGRYLRLRYADVLRSTESPRR